MSTPTLHPRSPMEPSSPTRTSSLRKLTRILRPTRRAQGQSPSGRSAVGLHIPMTPPSSPSLYSLSSEGESRVHLSPATDRADVEISYLPVSPTSSTFSSLEGDGDVNFPGTFSGTVPKPVVYVTSEPLGNGQEFSEPTPKTVDFMNHAGKARHGLRPRRLVIANQEPRLTNYDIPNGDLSRLQPLAPAEWFGSNTHAKKGFLGVGQLSPVESENRSPLSASSPSLSPSTPRPSIDVHRPYSKRGRGLDTPPYTARGHTSVVSESDETEPLTEHWRRPRAVSEPRSFLGTQIKPPERAETSPSTPTGYILSMPNVDSGPKSSSSQTISPPPRRSSLRAQTPHDVYFTAVGRRESRMYITDAEPDRVPLAPLRRPGHAHSSSDPVFPPNVNTSSRHATWSSSKMRGLPSPRPFQDIIPNGPALHAEGDSTPVSRKEQQWSGSWNRDDIQEVIQELRLLK